MTHCEAVATNPTLFATNPTHCDGDLHQTESFPDRMHTEWTSQNARGEVIRTVKVFICEACNMVIPMVDGKALNAYRKPEDKPGAPHLIDVEQAPAPPADPQRNGFHGAKPRRGRKARG